MDPLPLVRRIPAVVHAYGHDDEPGDVEIVARRQNGALWLVVTDQGHGMRPRADRPGMGLGLPLAATLAQRLDVETGPGGGTRVSMSFAAE